MLIVYLSVILKRKYSCPDLFVVFFVVVVYGIIADLSQNSSNMYIKV